MKKILFAVTVLLMGYAASAQNGSRLFDNYIAVKNALVSGDSKAASVAITAFQQSLKTEGDFAQKDALLKATAIIAKAGNIEKQRAAFNDVSTNLWPVVKGAEKGNNPVYYQYCPMKKAYWLSEEKEIKNPYYGSAMLTCGKVVETK